MRSLAGTLLPYNWCPYKRRNLGSETHIQERQCEDTQGEKQVRGKVEGYVCKVRRPGGREARKAVWNRALSRALSGTMALPMH